MQPTLNFLTNGFTKVSEALNATNGRRARIAVGSLVALGGSLLTVRSGMRATLQCVQDSWNYKTLAYAMDLSRSLESVELIHPTCKTQMIYTAVAASLTLTAIVVTANVAKRHFAKPPTPPKPGLPFPADRANVVRGSEQDINMTLTAPVVVVGQRAPQQDDSRCSIS